MGDHDDDETYVRSTGTSTTIGDAGSLKQRNVRFAAGDAEADNPSKTNATAASSLLTERDSRRKRIKKMQQEKEETQDEISRGTLGILVWLVGMFCVVGCIPLFVYAGTLGTNQPFLASSFEVTAFSVENNVQLPFIETTKLFPQFEYLGFIMLGTGVFYFVCLFDFLKIKMNLIGYLKGLKEQRPIHTTIAAGVIIQLLQYLPLVACKITQGTLVAIIILCGMGGIVCLACANSLLSSSISNDPKENTKIGKLLICALFFFYSVGTFAVFSTNIYAMIMNSVWYQHPDASVASYAAAYMFASAFFNIVLVVIILAERLTQRINIYTAEIMKITLLLFTFIIHFMFVFSALSRPNVLKNLLFE
jgi:hypothetical protein